MPNQSDLGSIKKFTYRKSKNIILNTINWRVLLILQAQKMFIVSEIFGSVFFSSSLSPSNLSISALIRQVEIRSQFSK